MSLWETNPVLVVEMAGLGVFFVGILLYCFIFDKGPDDD